MVQLFVLSYRLDEIFPSAPSGAPNLNFQFSEFPPPQFVGTNSSPDFADFFKTILQQGYIKHPNFEISDLKNQPPYNATHPNPYCRKKLDQCLLKSPEYHYLSLNEDINQTRTCTFAKHENYIARGVHKRNMWVAFFYKIYME